MDNSTPEQRARRRAEEFVGLLWHVASYFLVVPFLFFLDWRDNETINWAYWAAIPWAIGLAFHYISYLIGPRFIDRAYDKFLEQEKRKDASK